MSRIDELNKLSQAELIEMVVTLETEKATLQELVARLKQKNSRGAGRPTKLNEEAKKQLLTDFSEGANVPELAVKYGVSTGTIYKLINSTANVAL